MFNRLDKSEPNVLETALNNKKAIEENTTKE